MRHAARAGIDPVGIEALQAIAERHPLRRAETHRRVMDFEPLRAGADVQRAVRRRAAVDQNAVDVNHRRHRIPRRRVEVDDRDSAGGRDPDPPVAGADRGG